VIFEFPVEYQGPRDIAVCGFPIQGTEGSAVARRLGGRGPAGGEWVKNGYFRIRLLCGGIPYWAMTFSKLGLSSAMLEGVKAMGYVDPTPIQWRAIPLILEGRDVIGSAQTGTGKTAAFGLPVLQKLERHAPGPRFLILEPTRELAAQVETALRDFARFTDLRVAVVFGGVGYGRQMDALKHGVDVLVATPGRLLDHLERGTCKLNLVQHLVLDEADRMLDMGFLPDVKRIVDRCPRRRQTLLFSATIPPEIETLIRWAMKTPQTIEIGARRSPAETVKHVIYPVSSAQKTDLLLALLERVNYESVIVFCRTKHGADRVAQLLKRNQHAVAVLHSNRTQGERERALRGFRDGRYEVLVATDIASRGLDIEDVSHVINYDVPQHAEDYVHRIGRTGRAEARGDAFTLMIAEDAKHVQAIERFISQKIPRVKLEHFDYRYTALFEEAKPGQSSGYTGGVRAVRVHGGYHFAPGRRRRR
jgi:ATP-dependent RNA helicase RhlE